MRIGKLDNDTLNALILSKFAHTRSEVLCSPKVGVDCAAVDMGGRIAVLSTDPITAADKHLGALTVHVSCNDAAAAGAEPIGLLTTLLVPPSATEDDIARVADELSAAAKAANVEIIGGHTEVTDAVTRMEGGVFGAAWEMSEASGVGIEIDAAKVPLKPATQKICAALGLDPFRLLSSGAMLIACPDGETLANGLMQMGINAAVIGRAGGKGVRTANGDMIAPPGADELYKLYK